MMPLELLEFPDPRLRTVAKSVKAVDGKLIQLADRMLELMYSAPGIGLSASQVNFHQRMIVLDVSQERDQPYLLINPEITQAEGEIETNEGCLSVPGFFEPVTR
ncbi:MAG: peptide deformylase, partial [Pseudomonadales bacterium]